MKKLLLTLTLALVGTLSFAEDSYEYFTVRQANGACVSYKIDGLKLLFNDTQGIIVEAAGQDAEAYNPMNVEALFFSATDLTAIDKVTVEDAEDAQIYTIDGRLVASGSNARQGLAAGVYIMKSGNKSTKISVR